MYDLAATAPQIGDVLSVVRRCQALALSRAAYYRWRTGRRAPASDVDLHDHIQRIALEWPTYGYRRITAELRRRGWAVNHKHVRRLMRADNLLCLRKRGFVRTTDAAHGLLVYPNVVPELTVSGPDHLWVADITYIRLQHEFIYLAVILDAWSRRCIGWALDRHLEAELALAALRMALAARHVRPGLVHHSDRGVQYASEAYTSALKAHEIRISMGRRGNPYDNAQAERFMRTLKYEEVYLFEYHDFSEAYARIGHFLEEVYNEKRLHSALEYRPPAEFERWHEQRPQA
jgi:putative transposase